jgi:hypothetical protein
MRRLIVVSLAAFLVALLCLPAFAQRSGMPFADRSRTVQDQKRKLAPAQARADEAAYRAALDKIPDKKPADPWGGVRESEAAKTAK